MSARRRRAAATGILLALGALAWVAGCALAANPQPPTLWLPAPVKDLKATRTGDAVHLHWTMPKNTTDKVALRGDQQARFCWQTAPAYDPKACTPAGDAKFAPEKPADFTFHLPAELSKETPRPIAFYVTLESPAGKTAGPSNPAWAASGTAPSAVTGLQLETRAEGVVLHWQPSAAGPGLLMRIHRALVKTGSTPKPDESKGVPPPEVQTLEVDMDHADPGGAVDHDAILDRSYEYWAERIERVDAQGHALETAGQPSPTVTIDAKDAFPPAIPAGLVVVADAQAKAMDLSWTPDADADIAGYEVYRKDLTAGGAMQRITPKLLVPPSYTDAGVVAGHRYAYAVTAVDQDGNESARSGEVEEELPE
ncbi:MAG: fibronectin type III domain-containing protein [Acidobacteriota bacterium]